MIPNRTSLSPGLYLVATPIGNARDITLRALDVLESANSLAAEDTRTLRKLMEIHGISLAGRPCIAYHDHSNEAVRKKIIDRILGGEAVAYASEAGTPLVADPGYRLGLAVAQAGLPVIAIPGASAVLAALCVAGLPSDRFTFAGFAPNADGARRKFLEGLKDQDGTLVFYESPRRVQKFLIAATDILGPTRRAAICRELTKKFEEVRRGTLAELAEDPGTLKGEVVLVIGRGDTSVTLEDGDIDDLLVAAMERLSVKDAAAEIAQFHGLKKRDLYQRALAIREND